MTPDGLRRLGLPHPIRVETGDDGRPRRVEGREVVGLRAQWVVEEGWWTASPIRRRYLELVLDGGGLATVYEDLTGGGWHRHGQSLTLRSRVR